MSVIVAGPNPSVRHMSDGSAPAAAIGAIEDVQTDLGHLLHGASPAGAHILGVVMRRGTDLRNEDLARGYGHGDILRAAVVPRAEHAVRNAVAGKGELTAILPLVVLVDDAADRVGIGRIADPVENDLGNGGLTAQSILAPRLEVDRRWRGISVRPFGENAKAGSGVSIQA